MGSKDQVAAREAQEAFAAFLGPVVQEVIKQAGTAGGVYVDAPFDEDDSASFPLDLYYNETDNHVSVWQQGMAGGLPSSHVEGMNELKLQTYRLDSAVSLHRRYARKARLDVISKAIERMGQEVLVKQERNAWAVILKALYEAVSGSTSRNGKAGGHVIDSSASGVFQLDDLNRLMTLMRRINESFAAGTPDLASSRGLTDLYISPEGIEQIRGFAYQPMNTRTVDGSAGTPAGSSTALPLPDAVREDIYRSAGNNEIYGVMIHEMNEFGNGKKYNSLYNDISSATDNDVAGELVVGIDNSRGAFIRPVAVQSETGGMFNAFSDDQWSMRSDKLGWYGFLEEGRVCIDARAIVGLDTQAAL